MTIDNVERAWSGGPLRVVGTGRGRPVEYVCEACERVTKGGRYSAATEGVRWGLSENTPHLAWVCVYCELTSIDQARVAKAASSRQAQGMAHHA